MMYGMIPPSWRFMKFDERSRGAEIWPSSIKGYTHMHIHSLEKELGSIVRQPDLDRK